MVSSHCQNPQLRIPSCITSKSPIRCRSVEIKEEINNEMRKFKVLDMTTFGMSLYTKYMYADTQKDVLFFMTHYKRANSAEATHECKGQCHLCFDNHRVTLSYQNLYC